MWVLAKTQISIFARQKRSGILAMPFNFSCSVISTGWLSSYLYQLRVVSTGHGGDSAVVSFLL